MPELPAVGAFSVVIPWFNRPELATTLAANASRFQRYRAEVIVVNCGGEPDEVTRLIHGIPIDGLRQVVVPVQPFNKPLANNIGASCSSRECLFFLDSDVVLSTDIFRSAHAILETQPSFVSIRRIVDSPPRTAPSLPIRRIVTTQEWSFTDGRTARLRFEQTFAERCGPGLLLIRKPHFIAAGGFNSALEGWGFEDIDLQIRLQLTTGVRMRLSGSAIHLSHGDEMRCVRGGSLEADINANRRSCIDGYNRGCFTGTYEQDVRKWQAAIREPEPSAALPAY